VTGVGLAVGEGVLVGTLVADGTRVGVAVGCGEGGVGEDMGSVVVGVGGIDWLVGEIVGVAVGFVTGRASAVGVGAVTEDVGSGAGRGVFGIGEGVESTEVVFVGKDKLLVGVGCVVWSGVAVTTTVT